MHISFGTMIEKLFTNSAQPTIRHSLDVMSERHVMISSNIANQNTPGYKAVGMDFKREMEKAITKEGSLQMTTTDKLHLVGSDTLSNNVQYLQKSEPSRLDGNNVNVDKEMADLAENQLLYDALVQSLITLQGILSYAVNEGKR